MDEQGDSQRKDVSARAEVYIQRVCGNAKEYALSLGSTSISAVSRLSGSYGLQPGILEVDSEARPTGWQGD